MAKGLEHLGNAGGPGGARCNLREGKLMEVIDWIEFRLCSLEGRGKEELAVSVVD